MTAKQDGFGHEKPYEGITNDWITPPHIIQAFNKIVPEQKFFFDLDPCASVTQPFRLAKNQYTINEDGLSQNWHGVVYCNPPYGNNISAWAKKMAQHNNGVMLIYARVETEAWQSIIFPAANCFLFPRGRITFYHPDGTRAKGSGGAPSVLVGYGDIATRALLLLCQTKEIPGAFFGNAISVDL